VRAEAITLRDFVNGVIPRAVAMERLALDWYGDLLVRLNRSGIRRLVRISAIPDTRFMAKPDSVSD
jgi:hypothetical protein